MEIGTMNIGSKIRNARNEAGYTQEHAAEALKVSRQTISNWENEKSYPDIVSVIRMSDLYNVSLDHLLKEEKEVKDTYVEYLGKSTDTDGSFTYVTKDSLLDFLLTHMPNPENISEEERRRQYDSYLSTLKHWK